MVAALWSNSAWDEDNTGARGKAIRDLEVSHEQAVESIEKAFSKDFVKEEEKLSKDNPFFAAAERGLERVEREYKKKRGDAKPKVEEAPDYMKDLDQA
jgi:hypothetical protein